MDGAAKVERLQAQVADLEESIKMHQKWLSDQRRKARELNNKSQDAVKQLRQKFAEFLEDDAALHDDIRDFDDWLKQSQELATPDIPPELLAQPISVITACINLLQQDPDERMTVQSLLEYLRANAEASGLDASRLGEPHEACREAVRPMAEHAEANVQMAIDKKRARGMRNDAYPVGEGATLVPLSPLSPRFT